MGKFSARAGGFQIEFDNEVIVSVQFREFNYCERYSLTVASQGLNRLGVDENGSMHSKDAEIAVFYKDTGRWLTRQIFLVMEGKDISDDVAGYIEPNMVAKIMDFSAKLKEPDILRLLSMPKSYVKEEEEEKKPEINYEIEQEDDGEID